jgi:hypothetical protein
MIAGLVRPAPLQVLYKLWYTIININENKKKKL